MTTFTDGQQNAHREIFINECHQKAWGARCHADWIGKQVDRHIDEYKRLSDIYDAALSDLEKCKSAPDSHTYDNRRERKEIQNFANTTEARMQAVSKIAADLHKTMQQLHTNAEQNLSLAAHAEKWEWKEATPETPAEPLPNPEDDGPEAAGNKV